MGKPRNGLTPKQRKFAKEFVKTGNGTEAARRAGYSKHTANEIASENLAKPSIQEFVASLAADAETVKALRVEDIAAMTLNEAQHADHAGARVRAQELLLKWKGAFIERIEDVTKRQEDAIGLISQLAKISPDAARMLARDLGLADQQLVPGHDDTSASLPDNPVTH